MIDKMFVSVHVVVYTNFRGPTSRGLTTRKPLLFVQNLQRNIPNTQILAGNNLK